MGQGMIEVLGSDSTVHAVLRVWARLAIRWGGSKPLGGEDGDGHANVPEALR